MFQNFMKPRYLEPFQKFEFSRYKTSQEHLKAQELARLDNQPQTAEKLCLSIIE